MGLLDVLLTLRPKKALSNLPAHLQPRLPRFAIAIACPVATEKDLSACASPQEGTTAPGMTSESPPALRRAPALRDRRPRQHLPGRSPSSPGPHFSTLMAERLPLTYLNVSQVDLFLYLYPPSPTTRQTGAAARGGREVSASPRGARSGKFGANHPLEAESWPRSPPNPREVPPCVCLGRWSESAAPGPASPDPHPEAPGPPGSTAAQEAAWLHPAVGGVGMGGET